MTEQPEGGYTLIELLLVMTVMGIMVATIGNFIASAMGTYAQRETETIIQDNTRQSVQSVATTIRSAKSVEAKNSQPDSHSPGAPSDLYSWVSATGTGATLVLAVPAHDASGNLIYIDGQHQSVFVNNVVYYLDPTTHVLYRRIIANQSAPGNAAKTTCPPSLATAACPADGKVVEDVADLDITFYGANNNVVVTPSGTEAIQASLTQTKKRGGRTFKSTFTTVASLRNK